MIPPDYASESTDEASLLSFVIHIWKEEFSSADHQASWRGHITLMPTGKRHYFTEIHQIPELIEAHLHLSK